MWPSRSACLPVCLLPCPTLWISTPHSNQSCAALLQVSYRYSALGLVQKPLVLVTGVPIPSNSAASGPCDALPNQFSLFTFPAAAFGSVFLLLLTINRGSKVHAS